MNQEYERIIGRILENLLSIEWMRNPMFFVDNRYWSIPSLVFRVNEENEIFFELKSKIEQFKGKMGWKIISHPLKHHTNYILSIKEMESFFRQEREDFVSQEVFFGEEVYRDLCDKAIDDIPLLAEYLREQFKEYLSNSLMTD